MYIVNPALWVGLSRVVIHVAMLWFMNIINSTTQASVCPVLLMILSTHYLVTYTKPISQTCIQHILLLSVLSTSGAEGSSLHSLPFIPILLLSSTYMFPVTYKNTQQNTN